MGVIMKLLSLSMKLITFSLLLLFNCLYAQDSTKKDTEKETIQHNQIFIDEDGDGYNDNAPDHDGDGIPNGLDPDWQKLNEEKRSRQRFVDLDGDGINDNIHSEEDSQNREGQNLHQQKEGSSLDNRSKEEQQKQQKKQRGRP
jgi:hypothetical protein